MAAAVDWELAQRIAVRVAGSEPFADSYHYDSLEPDFLELTAQAEELVAIETGLRSLDGPARARITDRAGWIAANVASFQRLLRPITDKLDEKISASPMSGLAQRFAAAEVGAMLGWMSTRVLGQYDMLIIEEESPHDQDLVYYVGPNVLALEKRFAFPPREFRLWLALHEVTHRAQFTGVPWMRPHFLGLVEQILTSIDPDPDRFFDAFTRVIGDMRKGQNPLDDGGLMAVLATKEQKAVLDQVSGLMSLLEGHGDTTMDRAGEGLVLNADRFGRVLRERRKNGTPLTKLLQKIIGLEAKLNQYAMGEKFIEAVEATGDQALAPVWERPENLPTLAEIRDPDLWLARVQLAPVG